MRIQLREIVPQGIPEMMIRIYPWREEFIEMMIEIYPWREEIISQISNSLDQEGKSLAGRLGSPSVVGDQNLHGPARQAYP